jgi:uncharacterized protein DUF6064
MPEWWSYSLADFLMFAPRTWYRLVERHNEAVWPLPVLTLGLGLALMMGSGIPGRRERPLRRESRLVPAVLAALWTWVAWAFLWRRYAVINWAASYAAGLFALEALLLVWLGVVRGEWRVAENRNVRGALGGALLVASLLVYPALAALFGRPWRQAEVFGIAPDPTVMATIGLLLLRDGRLPWPLLAVPVAWCAFSGLTLLAMGSGQALAPALALAVVLIAGTWPERRQPASVAAGA